MTVPVISSRVLRGLPALIRDEIGNNALLRGNCAAGFDVELIEDQNFFIPQHALLSFVDSVGRSAGVQNLGLHIAASMDVSSYGNFGRYITEAETLGEAILRSAATLRYHSTNDKLWTTVDRDEVRVCYSFALAGNHPGYATVATAAAGELLSVFRAYLPQAWKPVRVELDLPRPRSILEFEDVFQCPVTFNAPTVAVIVERHRMKATSKRVAPALLTLEDVVRERDGGAPYGYMNVTLEQIRTRLVAGNTTIDDVARSMNTSVRTLQRELNRAGTDFRSLTNLARLKTATDLLRQTNVAIAAISDDLGYASPAGFTRAFRKATGYPPQTFRARPVKRLV